MVTTPGGLRLAPFYDLMCTRVYTGLGAHFAFTLAGESEPGKLEPAHITKLAQQLGVAPRYLLGVAIDVAGKVTAAIPAAADEVLPHLAPGERVLAKRLVQKISAICKKMENRLFHIT